jgi:hypothetical protein
VVKLQILSKCLNTGSFDIVTQNNLTEDYFLEYEEEFNFRRIIFNSSRFIAVEKATSDKK